MMLLKESCRIAGCTGGSDGGQSEDQELGCGSKQEPTGGGTYLHDGTTLVAAPQP